MNKSKSRNLAMLRRNHRNGNCVLVKTKHGKICLYDEPHHQILKQFCCCWKPFALSAVNSQMSFMTLKMEAPP